MSHIFISYSKDDIDFARHLRRLLELEEFAVWMDEARLVPSSRWWHEIERNIDTCDAFLVIMSPHGRSSDWVEREILHAERSNKPVFPVLLSGEVWSRLANIQYTDMQAGLETSLPPGLLQSLREVVTTGQAPPQIPLERAPSSLSMQPDPAHPAQMPPAQSLPFPTDLKPPETPPPMPRRPSRGVRSLGPRIWRLGLLSVLLLGAILGLVLILGSDLIGDSHDDDPVAVNRDPDDRTDARPLHELPEDEQRAMLIEQLHSDDRDQVLVAFDMLRETGWLYDGSLAGIDLREVDLSEMNLEGAQLPGVNFSGANLQETVFREANLEEAVFSGARLIHANLEGAHLAHAQIIETEAQSARFVAANLANAELVYSNFEDCNFTEADLSAANLEQSNIRWVIIDATRFNPVTILPDGQNWQTYTDMGRYLLPEHAEFWRSDDPRSPAHQ